MKQIQVQQLDREKFAQYGTFQNLLDDEDMAKHSVNKAGFFADLIALDFANTTLPTVSCCQVKKGDSRIIRFVEAHKYTCEGLLPIDGDVVIYVGRLVRGKFDTDLIEAFYVPQGTFVKLNPLIVHGTQYPVRDGITHILCQLPGRTFNNDMLAELLPEDRQVEIID